MSVRTDYTGTTTATTHVVYTARITGPTGETVGVWRYPRALYLRERPQLQALAACAPDLTLTVTRTVEVTRVPACRHCGARPVDPDFDPDGWWTEPGACASTQCGGIEGPAAWLAARLEDWDTRLARLDAAFRPSPTA